MHVAWPKRCFPLAGKVNLEKKIPIGNWPIILGLLLVNNIAYSVVSPSMYQFITSPRSLPKELDNDAVCVHNS